MEESSQTLYPLRSPYKDPCPGLFRAGRQQSPGLVLLGCPLPGPVSFRGSFQDSFRDLWDPLRVPLSAFQGFLHALIRFRI